MTTTYRLKAFAALAVVFCFRLLADAATLQAKVVQVDSGNTLVVTNISRPLRIKLKAVAPPENGQPFSEAAREHLKALVLDRPVVIEYTHLAEGYLEAKVILNGVDVGSQMLRDGVAWFDRASDYELSESDRDLYLRCEQAARAEKRGLWQDPAAVAPWEFRKAQLARSYATVDAPSLRPSKQSRSYARDMGLSGSDLLGGMIGPGSIAGNPTFRQISPQSSPGEWIVFRSTEPHFSIRVPGNSYQYEYPVLDGQKKIVNINYLIGSSDNGLYTLMWTKGSNDNATDATAAAYTIRGFLDGINQSFERTGRDFRATASPGRDVRLGSYAGKQYRITVGPLSGVMRVISKQIGDQREVIAVGMFTSAEEEASNQFVNTLKILGN